MINPLRSEAEAFRFVLGSLAYFGLIALASVAGGRWVGLGVFLALTAGLVVWWFRARAAEAHVPTVHPHDWPDDERHILVVANETVGGSALLDCIRKKSEGYRERVLVVCPALNSPLRHWVSDQAGARAGAQERLETSLARLRSAGVDARGEVGDADPLQAIDDALRTFGADEIIISTHPEGRSHWLERDIVEAARRRFGVPITHVVVDLAAEHDEVREAQPSK